AIEAHQPLKAADGFYAPELTEEGVVFRWTGPSPQFSFNVYIDRSQGADLRLETLSCIDPELQRKVSLFVDGESVALDVSASGDGFIATAELPKSAEAGATTLTFALPAALPPHGGDDSRQLGTAFRRLLLGARSETGMHTALIAAIAAAEPARAA
ncbi:MAG: hypothetical protein JO261_13775, partial [Alphaproteobacteria bacterium]|nr:hypothetical protein [Alphaproteobacteria bacterium]